MPASDTEFEQNAVVLFQDILQDPNVKRVGTNGQGQDGVDVIGQRLRDPHHLVGVQCKLKLGRSKLTARELKDEVGKALTFSPTLTEYIVIATSKDDTKLQQLALQLTQDQFKMGRSIHIEVWGWDTLQERINQSEKAKQAFDPGFSPSMASQERKLDALLAGHQQRQASTDQMAAIARNIGRQDADILPQLPTTYADRELRECLTRTFQRRGFAYVDTARELADLAERAIDGDLSLGSAVIRSEICYCAARANAVAETVESARRFRVAAAKLDPARDLFGVDAVLIGAAGDIDAAFRELKTRNDIETRSALLITLIRNRGTGAALGYARTENLSPADFNAPGAMNLILKKVDSGDFEAASSDIANTPDRYFDECPALYLVRAQLGLASILPADQKATIFQGLPPNPRMLQLAVGQKGQGKIKEAHRDLQFVLSRLAHLQLEVLRSSLSELDLWLQLEDADACEAARNRLAVEMSDPASTLRRVRLALAYDIPFNKDALQRHLAGQKEIGGWTPDERFAAFLIAERSGNRAEVAEFFARNHEDLFAQSDLARGALAGIEIETLARLARFEDARRHIALHKERADLSPEQTQDIEEIVARIEGGDEITALHARYAASSELQDLRILVMALREARDTKQLAIYAPQLAKLTKAHEDFDLAIKTLFQYDRFAELLQLVHELPDLVQLDDEYTSLKGWALYRAGDVMEAREVARSLLSRRRAVSDRELAINTSIETGDWGYLQAILARESEHLDVLPARDLMRLARLSLESGSPYLDHFRNAALGKTANDPSVYLAAYVLATERGEEYGQSQAHEWFQKAIALSGTDGPVQSVSMREVSDQASGWHERTEKIDQMLRQAEAPLFVVAQVLRRQLMNLTLGQALRNQQSADRKISYPIFAFSGAQPARNLAAARRVALDITALITLDYLGLLEKALGHFERAVIAPSTLSLLFLERQFLRVQQPSQLAKAQRIQKLISAARLKVVPDISDESRSQKIGRDLATLLAMARAEGGLVVRSAPVPKLNTLLEETVDMSADSAVLTDTHSVLSYLTACGRLDADARNRAEAYLKQVDAGWPTTQVIDAKTKLFLDDLTVTYLDFVGLLEPLTAAVETVYVHEDLNERTRLSLQNGEHVEALLGAIERVRGAVNRGLSDGRFSFSGRRADAGSGLDDEDSQNPSPTQELMSDLTEIEFVITDDRCLNKLPTWSDMSGRNADVATTLDVLDVMRAGGEIDEANFWRARHKLRAAGYYAVRLDPSELRHHLTSAPVSEQRIRETPELKAVRESLALATIHTAFIATEDPWLMGTRFAIYRAIEDVWVKTPDPNRARAEADWLWSILPDTREWCLSPEADASWAAAKQHVAILLGLMLVFVVGTQRQRSSYFDWLKEKVANPLRTGHPEIWDGAIEILKTYITRLMEGVDVHEPEHQKAAFALLINPLPSAERNRLLTDEPFRSNLGVTPEFWFSLNAELSVKLSSFHNALRAAVSGRRTATIVGRDGKKMRASLNLKADGQATLELGNQGFAFGDASLLSKGKRQRGAALERAFSSTPLRPEEEDAWRTIAKARPFTDREFAELMTALGATPEVLRDQLHKPQDLGPDTLMPDEAAYYDRLIAPLGGHSDFDTFIHGSLSSTRTALFERHPKRALRRMGYAALWQPLIPFELLSGLELPDVSALLQADDPFTLLFGFELCRSFFSRDRAFVDLGSSFLSKLLNEAEGGSKRCMLFSGLALITTINLRRKAKASGAPLFWVRLAALAHAGVLTDALHRLPSPERFLRWAAEQFYPDYIWHGVIDRRAAPRWHPDWVDPNHIHAELVGRVHNALLMIPESDRPPTWVSAVDVALKSLQKSGQALAAFFPGPFDDYQDMVGPLWPTELLTAIEEKLEKATKLSDVPELVALANSTRPSDKALANIQRLLNPTIDGPLDGDEQALNLLRACAHIGATSRSVPIADSVISHCFLRAKNAGFRYSVTDLFAVMAEACAAHRDPVAHRKLLGRTAANLCFATDDLETLSQLEAIFDCLGRRDEKLIPGLARAKAIARTKRGQA